MNRIHLAKILLLLAFAHLSFVVPNSAGAVSMSWYPYISPIGSATASVGGSGDEDIFAVDPSISGVWSASSYKSYSDEEVAAEATATVSLETSFDGTTFSSIAAGYASNSSSSSVFGASGSYAITYRMFITTDEPIWLNYSIVGTPVGRDGALNVSYYINDAPISGSGSVYIESGIEMAFGFEGYAGGPGSPNPMPAFSSNSTFTGTFSTVPEPSVSALFAIACVAAFRKRCR